MEDGIEGAGYLRKMRDALLQAGKIGNTDPAAFWNERIVFSTNPPTTDRTSKTTWPAACRATGSAPAFRPRPSCSPNWLEHPADRKRSRAGRMAVAADRGVNTRQQQRHDAGRLRIPQRRAAMGSRCGKGLRHHALRGRQQLADPPEIFNAATIPFPMDNTRRCQRLYRLKSRRCNELSIGRKGVEAVASSEPLGNRSRWNSRGRSAKSDGSRNTRALLLLCEIDDQRHRCKPQPGRWIRVCLEHHVRGGHGYRQKLLQPRWQSTQIPAKVC